VTRQGPSVTEFNALHSNVGQFTNEDSEILLFAAIQTFEQIFHTSSALDMLEIVIRSFVSNIPMGLTPLDLLTQPESKVNDFDSTIMETAKHFIDQVKNQKSLADSFRNFYLNIAGLPGVGRYFPTFILNYFGRTLPASNTLSPTQQLLDFVLMDCVSKARTFWNGIPADQNFKYHNMRWTLKENSLNIATKVTNYIQQQLEAIQMINEEMPEYLPYVFLPFEVLRQVSISDLSTTKERDPAAEKLLASISFSAVQKIREKYPLLYSPTISHEVLVWHARTLYSQNPNFSIPNELIEEMKLIYERIIQDLQDGRDEILTKPSVISVGLSEQKVVIAMSSKLSQLLSSLLLESALSAELKRSVKVITHSDAKLQLCYKYIFRRLQTFIFAPNLFLESYDNPTIKELIMGFRDNIDSSVLKQWVDVAKKRLENTVRVS